jgi:hypothetical protein
MVEYFQHESKGKRMFKIGDVVRVSFDRKIIECVIVDENARAFKVRPINAVDDGKDRTFWALKLWVMGF